MKRWLLALALAAMLCIGFAAGSVMTRAHAEGGQAVEFYRVVPLQRIDKTDPLAIKYSTQSGAAILIKYDGSLSNTF